MAKSPFDDEEHNQASGMLVQGVLCVVLGLTALIVAATLVFPELDNISALAELWSAGGGALDNVAITFLTIGSAASGLVLAMGLVGILGYVRRSRLIASVALAFIVGASALQIVGGALFLGVSQRSDAAVQMLGQDTSPPVEQRVFLDSAIAIYNRCCHSVYGNSSDPYLTSAAPINKNLVLEFQKEVLDCDSTPAPLSDLVETLGNAFISLVQTCYIPELYGPINKYINDFQVCDKFEKIVAPVDDTVELPTTSITLKAFLFGSGLVAEEDSVEDMVMVGFPGFYAPPGVRGSGCGLMHAKGIAWAQSIFVDKVGLTASIVLLICASLQLLSTLVVVALWIVGTDEAQEEWMDYDRKVGAAVGQEDKVDF